LPQEQTKLPSVQGLHWLHVLTGTAKYLSPSCNTVHSRSGSTWRPPADQCFPRSTGVQSMVAGKEDVEEDEW